MVTINNNFPSLIKYMGSKTEIIQFIEQGLNMVHNDGQTICDLFAGSATLAGALRGECNIISNDIQAYSQVLAKAYLSEYRWKQYPKIEELVEQIKVRTDAFHKAFPEFYEVFNYDREFTLEEFNKLEKQQQELITFEGFKDFDGYYLFTKHYSGTYWSYNQCVLIDSIKWVADQYQEEEPLNAAIIASLMFAMAYNSQSTGHYAQYRVANTISSMEDILIYRRKSIKDFFIRKLTQLKNELGNTNNMEFNTTTLDYRDCLRGLEEGTLVYADPPYCFVHYSRFYHTIETLVRYDYPEIKFKGRYREDRHQSPFCIKTQVGEAFEVMFNEIRQGNHELVLSYSDSATNTITLIDLLVSTCSILNNITRNDEIQKIREHIQSVINRYIVEELEDEDEEGYETINITNEEFFNINNQGGYKIQLVLADHNHSTMGRREDKSRKVKEVLIVARIRG